MNSTTKPAIDQRPGARTILRVWKELVAFELLTSLVSAIVLGPLLLALSYQLLEFLDGKSEGVSVLTNEDLFWFLLSPQGMLALVLGGSVTLGLKFLEYGGLILLAGRALRGATFSVRDVGGALIRATTRLFGLAAILAATLLAVAIPFLGLAACAYWLLLSGADVNYFLAERPPRFWGAIAIGGLLLIGFAGAVAWIGARWAFSLPAVVLDGCGPRAALQTSTALTRGRRGRLVLAIAGWELLKQAALFALLFGLDEMNAVALARLDGRLSLLVGTTVVLLLTDAVLLKLLAALFAIGLAGFMAYEYERSRRSSSSQRLFPAQSIPPEAQWPARRAQLFVVALAILGPAATLGYALLLERQFVDHRAVMVTAHRAGPKEAPENSLAALALGIAAGADYAEIDVQLTADGHVVLMHDRDLRRMTGDPRDVADVALADLQLLRLRQDGQPTAEIAPTLAQLIAACDGKIRLNIELKDFGRSAGLASAVLRVLREHNFTDRAVVSSFQLAPLAELRAAEPKLPVGAILSAAKGDVTQLPVDFLSLNHRLARADLVRLAHARGMQVHVWSVSDRDMALRLIDVGCDNLITSDPAQMREIVDWHAGLSDVSRMLMRLRRWMRE